VSSIQYREEQSAAALDIAQLDVASAAAAAALSPKKKSCYCSIVLLMILSLEVVVVAVAVAAHCFAVDLVAWEDQQRHGAAAAADFVVLADAEAVGAVDAVDCSHIEMPAAAADDDADGGGCCFQQHFAVDIVEQELPCVVVAVAVVVVGNAA
jgi:hypothetical protein